MSLFNSSGFGLPRLKPLPSKRSHVVSVLDIGSSKIVCMIGRLTPRKETQLLPNRTHNVEIIGIGHQRSHGVKSGVIADLDAVESVVRLAVDAAERMAGLTVDSLIVKPQGKPTLVPVSDKRPTIHFTNAKLDFKDFTEE